MFASSEGFELDIQISDESNWPGTVNGGVGIDLGNFDLDSELYQLEIPVRVLADNEAGQFRITMSEPDTPASGDEYQYHFDLFDLEEGEWHTFTRPLLDYDSSWTEGGDQIQEFGMTNIQIQTMWDTVDALNIQVGGVYVTPIDPIDDGVVFEFNGNVFTRGFVYRRLPGRRRSGC